jgi:hypothetical protein
VLEKLDIVAAAQGHQRALIRTVPAVSAGDSLTLTLTPAAGSDLPPILSAIELAPAQ